MSDPGGAPLGRVTTELGLAVGLVDGLAGGPPRVPGDVAVTNADAEFVRTPSGYHVLVDLPDEPATLEVAVTARGYLPETRTVDRSALDAASPLVTIDLVPGPAYPFGPAVTLVRGQVEETGEPVPGAAVAYVQGSDRTRTDAAGEFALPLTDVDADDVETGTDGVRLLAPGGHDPTLEATHPGDGRTATLDVTCSVGATTSATLAF